MKDYNHKATEKHWQAEWKKKKVFETKDRGEKNFYLLTEFPYPSGNLHVGHWYAFAVPDIYARAERMKGRNVLYPMGFDAFGLPAENAAIKRGINPKKWTYDNMAYMKKQLSTMGASFDWAREVVTADPEYYKWTQFFFTEFYKNGLAYQKEMPVNWCPSCKTVLANEQVLQGACERCGSTIEQRMMKQWNIRITNYAEKLLTGLDGLGWPEEIKQAQRNWIGKSEGTLIKFKVQSSKLKFSKVADVEVFTTRPDTLFGVTYVVLAPEHSFVLEQIKNKESLITNKSEVEDYINKSKKKTEIERMDAKKEKTGIRLDGINVVNPANSEDVPVFVADYVLASYGTGAVMAVPAHDKRDFEFAKKYNLPIKTVIEMVYDRTEGEDAVRKDKPLTERNVVMIIAKHWSEDKYICSEWKKNDWRGFPTGGIDGDESPLDTAVREIKEETGYKNILPGEFLTKIHSRFYQMAKNENRLAHYHVVTVKLKDGEREEMSDEEKAIHDVHWIPKNEVEAFINREDLKVAWSFFNAGNCYTGEGLMTNSGKFTGHNSAEVKKDITKFVNGELVTKYKLRDWVVSRQRYWGVPIPIIHCTKCGAVPVPTKDLPVKLPDIKDYLPRDDGKSPLAKAEKWIRVKCPKCKGVAERETDTLDTFVDSSWYYLRYTDPKNKKEFASKANMKKWMPVNFYSGGAEHTTMHLLYSRFFFKALHDLKLVALDEPYKKRMNRGLILGPDGNKMSKSKGNVLDPDDIVLRLGADTMRLYLAFIGPYNETGSYPWNPQSILGVRRFLERVYRLKGKVDKKKEPALSSLVLHQMLKRVSDSIRKFSFNTGVSAMMIFVNEAEKKERISRPEFEMFLKVLSAFAPHLGEELWHQLGNKNFIILSKWPEYDESLIEGQMVEVAVQINGKTRGTIELRREADEETAKAQAKSKPELDKWFSGQTIKRVIYVRGRIINFIITP